MKITDTKILIKPSDIKQIIIVNENNDPKSDRNNIAYVWNDTIAKPDKSDDFTIHSKDGFKISNLGFNIQQSSSYAQKNIILHFKITELDVCRDYGDNGRIGTVKNINSFPIPKEITFTKEQITEFKHRMKK